MEVVIVSYNKYISTDHREKMICFHFYKRQLKHVLPEASPSP